MAKPILIVGALKNEICELKGLIRTQIADGSVIVTYTGMGPDATNQALRRLLAETEVGQIIGVGYAGALTDGLTTGDLIAAEEVCSATSGTLWHSDADLVAAALQLIPDISQGRLLTVETACTDGVQKRTMGQRFQACAVDMESAALAGVAAEHAIPFLVLRSILDPVEATVPDPAAFMNAQQGVSKKKLATYLLKHPQSVWQLPQLAIHAKRARHSLNEAIPKLVRAIAG